MKYKSLRAGFSFIEILVVVTIIGIITTIGMVTYTGFMKQSRDAKRKGDMEQIRGALEMYKSKNNLYPLTLDLTDPDVEICDPLPGTDCYLTKLPRDPVPANTYFYQSTDGSTYTIGALLEQVNGSPSTCGTCKSSPLTSCNYCMGPFGQL